MKTQIRRRAASLLVLFATLLCCATARAQVKLYIPDFTVNDYNPVTVNIMLDNSVPVLGYSFNIEMPDELEIVPGSVVKTTGRFNQGQTLTYRNGVFGCVSMQDFAFSGESGTVGTFQVRAKNGVIGDSKKVDITLRNLTVVGQDFSNTVKIPVQTTTVTLEKKTVPVVLTLSATPQSFLVNPGGVQQIAVAMDNDVNVESLQMDITLPAGFSYKTDGGNIFQQTARLSGGATITPLTDGDRTRLVVIDMMENRILTPGNGDFMTFEIVAPEDFDAESAQITISGAQASVNFTTVQISPVTMTVANGHTAYAKAQAEIAELERQLAEARQTIATDAPDVKDDFQGEEITAAIETLRQAVEDAYAAMTLTPDYDNVMAPAAGIEESIAALVVAAKAAQKAHDDEVAAEAARQEAYKNANAVVAGLEQKLAEALATIAESCPDVKDNFKGEAVSASIAAMHKAIDEAYAGKTIVENYENLVAPAAGIETAIAKLVEDAKASQKAFEENARLESARLNANSELASLDKALADALAEIAVQCPDVKYLFPGTEIQQQITVLRNAVNAAYDAKTLADEYDEVMTPAAAIRDSIAKLVEDAKAAQKKFEDDAAAEKALLEAYKNANAGIDALRAALAQALATIAETCPDVKDDFKGEEIEKSIAALKESVKDAFDTKTLAEDYDKVMAPAADIEAAIAKLVESATAAQKAYEEAEAARRAANKAAYEADLAAIAQLQAELDKAKATIEQQYPGYDFESEYDAVKEAIEEQKKRADDEYESVAEEGIYDNEVDSESVMEMIAKMIEAAKTNGIDMILGEELTDSDRIFTLDGMQVARPQKGKVNIIVKSDGRILKTYVR